MGSPALALSLGERLRPFYGAGLTHVFRTPAACEPAQQAAKQSAADADFAPPWSDYLAKAQCGAQVVFTYGALALDLSGKGDPRRGKLFRELIRVLGWSGKGLHSFWPLRAAGEQEPNPAMFWQGLHHIGSHTAVIFGPQGACTLLQTQDIPSSPLAIHGHTIYIMPTPEELLAMLPHERHLAVDPLRTIRFR